MDNLQTSSEVESVVHNAKDVLFSLANSYYHGTDGKEQDCQRAAIFYEEAAKSGHVEAQQAIAECYFYGKGVPKNPATAAEWLSGLDSLGNAKTDYLLGLCFEKGYGVEQSYEKAVALYQKAADQKNADATFELARCYLTGKGVPKDPFRAYSMFQDLSSQGHVIGEYGIGLCHEQTGLTESSKEMALDQYKKAAEGNHMEAQLTLGHAYRDGVLVAMNLEEAREWYHKAMENGSEEARKAIQDLETGAEAGKGRVHSGIRANDTCTRFAASDEPIIEQLPDLSANDLYKRGIDYYYGKNGQSVDFVHAVSYFRPIAERGHAKSQGMLGLCYCRI
jgi:uncharacterized protein